MFMWLAQLCRLWPRAGVRRKMFTWLAQLCRLWLRAGVRRKMFMWLAQLCRLWPRAGVRSETTVWLARMFGLSIWHCGLRSGSRISSVERMCGRVETRGICIGITRLSCGLCTTGKRSSGKMIGTMGWSSGPGIRIYAWHRWTIFLMVPVCWVAWRIIMGFGLVIG